MHRLLSVPLWPGPSLSSRCLCTSRLCLVLNLHPRFLCALPIFLAVARGLTGHPLCPCSLPAANQAGTFDHQSIL